MIIFIFFYLLMNSTHTSWILLGLFVFFFFTVSMELNGHCRFSTNQRRHRQHGCGKLIVGWPFWSTRKASSYNEHHIVRLGRFSSAPWVMQQLLWYAMIGVELEETKWVVRNLYASAGMNRILAANTSTIPFLLGRTPSMVKREHIWMAANCLRMTFSSDSISTTLGNRRNASCIGWQRMEWEETRSKLLRYCLFIPVG